MSSIATSIGELTDGQVLAVALAALVLYEKVLPSPPSRARILLLEVPSFVVLFYFFTPPCCSALIKTGAALHLIWRYVRCTGNDEPVTGAVFVTGSDSGMGETTALHLARTGYHVFAGCYMKESFQKYDSLPNVTPVQIDVSDQKSVAKAAADVEDAIEKSNGAISGLYGVLQCAGIAYIAPFEYIPIEVFQRQVDVNFYGYVYVAKAFLPLVKSHATRPGGRRGRLVFVSSGPLPGPGVPFITSYLAAKWAMDAVCQGLRMEMRMRQLPIDCVMLAPGVVKPTRLAEEGEKLLDKTFNEMVPEADAEYREMVECFRTFQLKEPGTHVRVVGKQMEAIMRHGRPRFRYYVGPDAVAATVVGCLPTGLREHLLRNTLLGGYGKTPRWMD